MSRCLLRKPTELLVTSFSQLDWLQIIDYYIFFLSIYNMLKGKYL